MNKKLYLAPALALCFGFMGCGSSDFNATYSGTVTWSTGTSLPTQFYMTLYQQGSNIYGEFSIEGSSIAPMSGTITGTESGSTLTLSFSIPQDEGTYATSAAETLTSTMTLSGTTLSGTISGSVSTGSISGSASLTQTK